MTVIYDMGTDTLLTYKFSVSMYGEAVILFLYGDKKGHWLSVAFRVLSAVNIRIKY